MNNLKTIETGNEIDIPASFFEGSDIQISTAKKYPRNVQKCMKEAEDMALMNEDISESCVYGVPRAGGVIRGPSVRLAEIFVSSWGNIHMASEVGEAGAKTISGRAYCWDLEKNIRIGIEVKRNICDKYGKRYNGDMIEKAGNAAASIALRNAIFKVIPRSCIDSIMSKCLDKSSIKAPKGSFKTKRDGVFKRFSDLGIPNERILTFFNKTSIDQFDEEDVKNLLLVGTSIKDGYILAEDAFKFEETKSETLANQLLDRFGNDVSQSQSQSQAQSQAQASSEDEVDYGVID